MCSHPVFNCNPSKIDINTQRSFQNNFLRDDAQFIGLIVGVLPSVCHTPRSLTRSGPYDKSLESDVANVQSFWVHQSAKGGWPSTTTHHHHSTAVTPMAPAYTVSDARIYRMLIDEVVRWLSHAPCVTVCQICLVRYYETYAERTVMSSQWRRGGCILSKLQSGRPTSHSLFDSRWQELAQVTPGWCG